jgi:hypothetical protein
MRALMSGVMIFSVSSCMQEEDETDELLLLDEEMLDADPELLPRRLLTNFAIYNAEVGR